MTAPRASPGYLHGRLREATCVQHAQVDAAFSGLQLANRDDYGVFLNLHKTVLLELQPRWRAEDQYDFQDMARCLQEDLTILGVVPTLSTRVAAQACNPLERIGAAYVLRGARLGAKVLRKRVPAHFTATYLDCQLRTSWTEFLWQLNAVSLDRKAVAEKQVIRGATQTFGMFLSLLNAASPT